MPIALERTYYTDVDYALDTSSALNFTKSCFWALKAALKKEILNTNSASVSAWTCVGSSDSATAGMDGTDRWTSSYDATKIVRGATNGTNANSWIVLKHPTASIWLTLQFVGSNDQVFVLVVANVLPTGGSTTSRPTSTSEIVAVNGQQFVSNSAGAGKAHICWDSESYFIWAESRNGTSKLETALGIQKVAETKSGDANPWALVYDYGASAGSFYYNNTANVVNGSYQWRTNGGPCKAFASTGAAMTWAPSFWAAYSSTVYQGGIISAADASDGKFADVPLYLLGYSGVIGVKGRLYDWRIVAGPANGSIYPAVPPGMTHLATGNCWIPWTAQPTL